MVAWIDVGYIVGIFGAIASILGLGFGLWQYSRRHTAEHLVLGLLIALSEQAQGEVNSGQSKNIDVHHWRAVRDSVNQVRDRIAPPKVHAASNA